MDTIAHGSVEGDGVGPNISMPCTIASVSDVDVAELKDPEDPEVSSGLEFTAGLAFDFVGAGINDPVFLFSDEVSVAVAYFSNLNGK